MARWSLRRQSKRSWVGEPPIPTNYGRASNGGRPDTPVAAMQIPAVWACVRLLSETVSMMKLDRYRETADGVPARVPLGALLSAPAASRTLPEWLSEVMLSALLRGNTWGRKVGFDPMTGEPMQIELQNPDRCHVKLDPETGGVKYFFNNKEIPSAQVWHMRGFTMPGDIVGMSPISYAAQTLSLASRAEDFGESFFSDGAHPSAVLTTDQTVDQDGATTLKERFRQATNGREPVVLGLGVKYEPIQVSPEESQFLETQKFSIAQIARVFGVPPEMIGGESGGSMTYANIEQRSIDFLTYSIQPWLTRIESSLSAMLPTNEFVRFDTSVLTRTDTETRVKVQAIQLAANLRTNTEQRAADGLAPLTPEQIEEQAKLSPITIPPPPGTKPKAPAKPEPGTEDEEEPTAEGEAGSSSSEKKSGSVEVHVHNHVAPAEARVEVPVTVLPAEARVEVPINVEARAPEVLVQQPITVHPAQVHLPATQARTVRTVERNSSGDITRIIEE